MNTATRARHVIFLFNFDNPYTKKYYKYTRSESTSKIFYTSIFRRLVLPFSVVNPHLLPINQTVNDHSFFVCANGINQNLFCIFQRDFRQAFNLLVKLVHHFTNFICQFRSLYFRKTLKLHVFLFNRSECKICTSYLIRMKISYC